MFAKRSLGCDLREVPVAKRFRLDLADALLANELSGQRVGTMATNAALAGAANVSDLGARGSGDHACRNMIRRLLKGSKWPDLYHAPVTVVSPVSGDDEVHFLPMCLPHEVVQVICTRNPDRQRTHGRAGLDAKDLHHLDLVETQCGVAPGSVLGLGLWLDGVATKWDRTNLST